MIERLRSDANYYRAEYWKKPGVKKAISEFLGSKVMDRALWEEGDVSSEFLGLANRDKLNRPDKVSPSIIIEPEEFKDYYEVFDGQFELHNSMWQRESVENSLYPNRALFVWDLEIYDRHSPLSPIENPEDTFNKLESIYNILNKKLEAEKAAAAKALADKAAADKAAADKAKADAEAAKKKLEEAGAKAELK